jgi:hypothetical protein
MGVADFLLFPVYVAIFYFIFSARRKNYDDPVLKYYHKKGFWIKIATVIPFSLFCSILSPGDSYILYYQEGANLAHLILNDFSNIKWLFTPAPEFDQELLKCTCNLGYLLSENNYMVVRITTVLSFFALNKYLIINLFFSLLSFSGSWKLYRFFYEQYPHLHKQFAIAILYLPTFVFWSSGILKDSICTGAIGWLSYALYEVFYKKKSFLVNSIIIFIAGYLLYAIKVYILISYVPFFALFLVLKNANLFKNKLARTGFISVLVILSMTMFTTVMRQLASSLDKYGGADMNKNISSYQGKYEMQDNATSNFSLGVEFDGSNASLIKISPAAITATLFRPFLWESKKLSTLFTSFESLAMMLLTLSVFYRAGPRNFFGAILKDPLILYCFLFALLFALFVGATTANFGTLVRYKIQCTPFYLIAMFLIQDRTRKLKNSPAVSGTV